MDIKKELMDDILNDLIQNDDDINYAVQNKDREVFQRAISETAFFKELESYRATKLTPAEIEAMKAENAEFKRQLESGEMVRFYYKYGDVIGIDINDVHFERSAEAAKGGDGND